MVCAIPDNSAAVRTEPGVLHIANVFGAGYRTFAESSVFNRLQRGLTRARTEYRMLFPFYARQKLPTGSSSQRQAGRAASRVSSRLLC
jgi:hypothetical protein